MPKSHRLQKGDLLREGSEKVVWCPLTAWFNPSPRSTRRGFPNQVTSKLVHLGSR